MDAPQPAGRPQGAPETVVPLCVAPNLEATGWRLGYADFLAPELSGGNPRDNLVVLPGRPETIAVVTVPTLFTVVIGSVTVCIEGGPSMQMLVGQQLVLYPPANNREKFKGIQLIPGPTGGELGKMELPGLAQNWRAMVGD